MGLQEHAKGEEPLINPWGRDSSAEMDNNGHVANPEIDNGSFDCRDVCSCSLQSQFIPEQLRGAQHLVSARRVGN